MSATSNQTRRIVISPASIVTDFVGLGFASQGMAQSSLENLSPVYGTDSILHLASLRPYTSAREQRHQGRDQGEDQPKVPDSEVPSFQIFLFKKVTPNLPDCLAADQIVHFFDSQFSFPSDKAKNEFQTAADFIVSSALYHVLAITILVYNPEEKRLTHRLIGCSLYIHDKNGSFIFTIGVLDRGDPNVVALNNNVFVQPTPTMILSATSSFRRKGLATFMLSLIQYLGVVGYKSFAVEDPTAPFEIPCSEINPDGVPKGHHLFLQARIEPGSAYMSYLKIGFTLNTNDPLKFRCKNYKKECPVSSNRPPRYGYYVDDKFQRLLSLKHWIYNVSPPDSNLRNVGPATDLIWDIPGLPPDQYLSSALVTPSLNDFFPKYTNAAFLGCLNCRSSVGFNHPIDIIPEFATNSERMPRRRDPYVLVNHDWLNTEVVIGNAIPPSDLCRQLLRGLNAHDIMAGTDAFDAMIYPLYLDGIGMAGDVPESDISTSTLGTGLSAEFFQEMNLELRLNVAAFYSRCAYYPIANHTLTAWINFAFDEYDWCVENELMAALGLQGFYHSTDREAWIHNFRLLARRISAVGDNYKNQYPALWMDVSALQMLFSRQVIPVYFAPVYGVIRTMNTADEVTDYQAFLQVPQLIQVIQLPGQTNRTLESLADDYRVVPLFVTGPTDYCHLSTPTAELEIFFPAQVLELPLLKVLPAELMFEVGHCASEALCLRKEESKANIESYRCPGCGIAVHRLCGVQPVNPGLYLIRDSVTCFLCYHKFGRSLLGNTDPHYLPMAAVVDPKAPESPAKHTRAHDLEPDGVIPPLPMLDLANLTQTRFQRTREENISSRNPSYMYPGPEHGDDHTEDSEWWLQEDGKTPRTKVAPKNPKFMADQPVETHVYTQMELNAHSQAQLDVLPQTFFEIIEAARTLQRKLSSDEQTTGPASKKPWILKPDRPYSDQELVNLCCLVDRGRSFSVETNQNPKRFIKLVVDSYTLLKTKSLSHHLEKLEVSRPKKEMVLTVSLAWLKEYLDWFDPDLFHFITIHTKGVEMLTLPNRLAGRDQDSYDQQGVRKFDKGMVTLPKTHKIVTTATGFGRNPGKPNFLPYYKHASSTPRKDPQVDGELIASCNPEDFEEVPLARAGGNIPPHLLQIKAISVEIMNGVQRWLGQQGDKYVSLPLEWVLINFSPEVRKEAIGKASETGPARPFIKIKPGDSREDDPPNNLRHEKGANYYFQGTVDNCLMGGLANAVFWKFGKETADQLLEEFIPMTVGCWTLFNTHVNKIVKGHTLHKITCPNVLTWDDDFPLVVQLRSKDLSESHAICIMKGCIFDSASRYVLKKCLTALNWCAGTPGFEQHLRVYQLLSDGSKPAGNKKRRQRT